MSVTNQGPASRWSEARINHWYSGKPWMLGCNFIPSSAINQVEMWSAASFDEETIRRELGWAAQLGFNVVRVFLHDLVWRHEGNGFLERVDRLLSIADENRIGVMLVVFDGVWDPHPSMSQREPRKLVHNSGWLQSPGARILADASLQDALEDYVKTVISAFANDQRVWIWDLFNEPDNLNPTSYLALEPANKSELSMRLLSNAFRWARDVNPSQPLTAGLWYGDWSDPEAMKAMDHFMVSESDLISFHNYEGPDEMEQRIGYLSRFNRPVVCTEFMARTFNNRFENIVPLFRKYNVGGFCWGFVDGKSQTRCPWDSWLVPYDQEPLLWFHDVLHKDGRPYIQKEADFLRNITGARTTELSTSSQL